MPGAVVKPSGGGFQRLDQRLMRVRRPRQLFGILALPNNPRVDRGHEIAIVSQPPCATVLFRAPRPRRRPHHVRHVILHSFARPTIRAHLVRIPIPSIGSLATYREQVAWRRVPRAVPSLGLGIQVILPIPQRDFLASMGPTIRVSLYLRRTLVAEPHVNRQAT
jgi:hypothetical protein